MHMHVTGFSAATIFVFAIASPWHAQGIEVFGGYSVNADYVQNCERQEDHGRPEVHERVRAPSQHARRVQFFKRAPLAGTCLSAAWRSF